MNLFMMRTKMHKPVVSHPNASKADIEKIKKIVEANNLKAIKEKKDEKRRNFKRIR